MPAYYNPVMKDFHPKNSFFPKKGLKSKEKSIIINVDYFLKEGYIMEQQFTTVIVPQTGLMDLHLKEVWKYRDLVFCL